MPRVYRGYRRTLAKLHPNWELKLWTEKEVENFPLVNRDVFDHLVSAKAPVAQVVDLLRYEIVAQRGGVYLDTDFEFFNPLDPLIERRTDLLVSFEIDAKGASLYTNSFFAATPSHPLFARCIAETPARVQRFGIGGDVAKCLGPHFLDEKIRELFAEGGAFVVAGHLLYPYGYWEAHRHYENFPDAIAAHRWGASWSPRRSPLLGPLNDVRKHVQWYIRGKAVNAWRRLSWHVK